MNLLFNWIEYLFLALLIVGFVLALTSGSAVISYVVIFFIGVFVGRVWYYNQGGFRFPTFIVVVGFLIGYLFGAWITRYGNGWIILILFVLGLYGSYYAHERKWV